MYPQDYLHINMQQIYYFTEVMECRSFSIAAQNLYTTQSTLSKSVSSLEQTLDVQLFIRNYRRLIPTEAANHLYRNWKKMLTDLESSVNECRLLQGGHAHSLSIGVLDTHKTENFLQPLLLHFRQEHPDISLSVHAGSAQDVRRQLFNDSLDLIFTVLYDMEQLNPDEFQTFLVNECPHNVCMLRTNPLAEREYLEITDLKDSHFVIVSPMYVPTYTGMIEDLCSRSGFQPHISRYTASASALPYNLLDDTDIFICDRNYKDYGNPAYAFRPVIHSKSGIVAAWKKNNKKKALKHLTEELQRRPLSATSAAW